MKSLCRALEAECRRVVLAKTMSAQPDSRALGAYVEKRIRDNWDAICVKVKGRPAPIPGRRSIYDVALEWKGKFIGIDIKTKDLDEMRYADGGVCSVDNLLRFMVHRDAALVLIEVSYRSDQRAVTFSDVVAAPIHSLPAEIYRIENLGTGQLRLNSAIATAVIDWGRSPTDFFRIFSPICLIHYKKVAAVANKRLQRIRKFESSGFKTY